jgi:MFS family permease
VIEEQTDAVPPIVRKLGWVSLLADASTEMLYPILPIFLTTTLGAPAAVVGLIEGLADGVSTGLRAVAGIVADRVRDNRVLVVAGYTVSSLAKPLLALAPGWGMVAALRVTDRVGKAFRGVPRDVMIADAVPAEKRGQAFGYHRSMDTAGAVIGPLIALVLLAVVGENHLRTVFLVAFVPGIATVALVLTLPRNRRPPASVSVSAAKLTGPPLPWRGQFGYFVAAVAIFSLGNSSDVFLLLRAKDLGLSTSQVVLAFALFNLVNALASRAAGKRADRIGKLPVFRSGLAVFAAVYLGFAVAPSSAFVWPLLAVYGIYVALTDGVGRALVVDLVPAEIRGKALGVSQAVTGSAVLVAGIVAGLLWDQVSHSAPFVVGAGAAVVAFAMALRRPSLRSGAPAVPGSGRAGRRR